MPEGDTVFRVAKHLNETFASTTLIRGEIRTGKLGSVDLGGKKVLEVTSYGKHLLVRMPDMTLRCHLRMDGVWHIYPKGAKWKKPAHQARIILENQKFTAVGYLLSDIDLVEQNRQGDLVAHLGPDVLSNEWETKGFEIAAANLVSDDRPIHVALLDQKNVAGFGNEYANELCFLRGVNPWQQARSVEIEPMLKLGRKLIVANLNRNQRTTTGNTRPGQRHYVYARLHKPCRRCGTAVRFGRLGETISRTRHVYWCPTCQVLKDA